MTDSIARQQLPVPLNYPHTDREQVRKDLIHELALAPQATRLKTKSLSDPTVALLDAWATIADVIGFYQERIATESFLTTATEPGSVRALANLLGYQPRPGLAATCWLAYTLVDDTTDTAVVVPKHQLVQSVPGAGQLPQTFETGEDLLAHPSWNTLPIKDTAPLQIDPAGDKYPDLVVSGAVAPASPNDVVLITLSSQPASRVVARVGGVTLDFKANTATVTLQQDAGASAPAAQQDASATGDPLLDKTRALFKPLNLASPVPPQNDTAIARDPKAAFPVSDQGGGELSDTRLKVLAALHPLLSKAVYTALATSTIGTPQVGSVEALRVTSAPFGVQIPPRPRFDLRGQPQRPEEWPIDDTQTLRIVVKNGESPTFVEAEVHLESATATGDSTIKGGNASPPSIGPSDSDIGITIDPAHPETIEFIPLAPTSATVTAEHITVSIDDENEMVTVKNESSGTSVSVSLADAVVATDPGANVPAPSAASSGLFLRIEFMPTAAAGGVLLAAVERPPGQFVIDVVSALPLRDRTVLDLNERHDEIVAGSYVMIENGSAITNPVALTPNAKPTDPVTYPVIAKVVSARPVAVNRYGMSPTVTSLKLDTYWIGADARLLSDLRPLTVHAQSVGLDLLPVPITDPLSGSEIDLSGLHPGIDVGHRLVITGTRADLGDADVPGGEMLMVSGVTQTSNPGESPYTTLSLFAPLAYSYRPDTVKLYGNVVPAHHGISTTETLSPTGDPANPMFTLSQAPVLADPSGGQSGFASSLTLIIDGRTWTSVPRLDNTTPPRSYITGTDGQGRTTITLGQPLPHSTSTVTATYRAGVGSAGNVNAGQLTQLLSRQVAAVSAVTNPLAASGGSDPDMPDAVRIHGPRGLQALGRVVSVDDAADIAKSWPGIGKALAKLASDGQRDVVRVTVAGVSATPLLPSDALIADLGPALTAAGDVVVPIEVSPAAISLIVLVATIQHDPDVSWDTVERAVRTKLTDAYGYDHRDIDEDIIISDLIAVIHGVDGVLSCAVTGINVIPYDIGVDELAVFTPQPPATARITVEGVAYISDTVADTLILQEG